MSAQRQSGCLEPAAASMHPRTSSGSAGGWVHTDGLTAMRQLQRLPVQQGAARHAQAKRRKAQRELALGGTS
eukprot:363234-Chlamydomonas_euryale.AAC.3